MHDILLSTLRRIMDNLPSDQPLRRIARYVDITEGHMYNTMKSLADAKILQCEKHGRSIRVRLLPRGEKLKEALESLGAV